MGDHVFVSYARQDQTYVEELASYLRSQGFDVWTDAAIYGGAQWLDSIVQKIDSCAAYIVVMSPEARRSQWVQREILRAQAQKKQIMPLLLAGDSFFEVSNLQYGDVRGALLPPPKWIRDLRATIDGAMQPGLPGDAQKESATTQPAVPSAPVHAQLSAILTGHGGAVLSVAFAPDRRILATGSDDRSVRLWDLPSGKQVIVLTGHTDAVCSVAFAPDGRTLATGSYDQSARIWEIPAGRHLTTLTGHGSWVLSVAISADGDSIATGSFDNSARLWNLKNSRR